MRWSFEELYKAFKTEKKINWQYSIVYFPVTLYKRLKMFIHWLVTGYCKESLYSLNSSIYYSIYLRLDQALDQHMDGNIVIHDVSTKTDLWLGFYNILNSEPAAEIREYVPGEILNKDYEYIGDYFNNSKTPKDSAIVISLKDFRRWQDERQKTLDMFSAYISTLK